MNILCGENAQGKTNLLEAAWLCSGCKSFRGTRDRDFIGFDRELARISLTFQDASREQKISFAVCRDNLKEKRVTLNGVKLPLLSRLFGTFTCVLFTPGDLELVKGGPENRRSFLDMAVSQIQTRFVGALVRYNSLLAQRNALLKEIGYGRAEPEDLSMWDGQTAQTGALLTLHRAAYVRKLEETASRLYQDLSQGREELSLTYRSTAFSPDPMPALGPWSQCGEEWVSRYARKLGDSVLEDIRMGFTQYGVHRDDLLVKINGLSARDFGSQGQQRSAALALKLSQALLLREERGETPVVLLDDVLSELDDSRQDFILNRIGDMQLFVTCCDPAAAARHRMGKVFRLSGGEVEAIE